MRTLSNLEAVRMYPNNYLGSSSNEIGVFQTFKEILSNSIDEANSGYGDEINVRIYKDGSISVEDFGRGVPMGKNPKEKKYNWEIVFTNLHGGGKFAVDRSNYKAETGGQHGIGAAATVLTSRYAKVISKRAEKSDTKIYEINFRDGKAVEQLQERPNPDKETGTFIHWLPAEGTYPNGVFTEVNFETKRVAEWIKLQSIISSAKFNFVDERVDFEESYYVENGIKDWVQGGKSLSKVLYLESKGFGRDANNTKPYEVASKIAFQFKDDLELERLSYHNSIPLTSNTGTHIRAVERAFADFFQERLKVKDLDIEDINVKIAIATFTFVPPSFTNQTKTSINNKFIEEFLVGEITKELTKWSQDDKKSFETVLSKIDINRKSRKTAENTRLATKNKLSKNLGGMKKSDRIEKFVNCRSKNPEERMLIIVEGDSAGGSIRHNRNPETQAVFPIKGKIRNVLDLSYTEAIKTQEVDAIIRLIGTGHDNNFDIKKANFNKIVIANDFDSDGFHIASLLITLFYRFMPKLIENGYIYQLMTPLYEVTLPKGKRVFAYSETEMEDIQKKYKGKKLTVKRNKGLGEVNQNTMRTLLTEDLTLRQITMESVEEAKDVINIFMGKDSEIRKEYIVENLERIDLENAIR